MSNIGFRFSFKRPSVSSS